MADKVVKLVRSGVAILDVTGGKQRVERNQVVTLTEAQWDSVPEAQQALFDVIRDDNLEDRVVALEEEGGVTNPLVLANGDDYAKLQALTYGNGDSTAGFSSSLSYVPGEEYADVSVDLSKTASTGNMVATLSASAGSDDTEGSFSAQVGAHGADVRVQAPSTQTGVFFRVFKEGGISNPILAVNANGTVSATGGDVEVVTVGKGIILKSPDGTRYRIKVADGGGLSAEAV